MVDKIKEIMILEEDIKYAKERKGNFKEFERLRENYIKKKLARISK